jgi:hypothetical protein
MADDRLRLSCRHGSFTALLNADHVQTVWTDYAGTSRSSVCKPIELIVFAMAVLDFYTPEGSLKIRVGSGS